MARADSTQHPDLPGFDYVEVLGSGGFSDVYLYRQKLPRRRVAVKVLRLEAEDAATRREFVAEANAMAQLSSHPSIATIFAADISPAGHPYLVMEYCPGGSLAAKVKSAPLPVAEVLNVGVRMASALESAHRAGIIHRDVKPSNILLNELKSPVLTDFGISIGGAVSDTTIMRDSTTATTRSSGLSVPWAPPEAFLDDPPSDPRSDVYSLAATLFTLLEQRTPFELATGNNGAIALSRRIERGEITPLTRGDVPASVHAVLRDAMAVDIDSRPVSALTFAESLQHLQRVLELPETPIEILGELEAETGTPEVVSAETTVVRKRTPAEPTMVRVVATLTEVDVDTRPRPDRESPGASETRRAQRKRRVGRIVAIVAGAALVLSGVAAIVILTGTRIPPCSSRFADEISLAHDGADVTAIWWGSVPELLAANPNVVCGVATGEAEIYVIDGANVSRISTANRLESNTDWSCSRAPTRYSCNRPSTGAGMIMYPGVPSDYAQQLLVERGGFFLVEFDRSGLPSVSTASAADATDEVDEGGSNETGIPLCTRDFLVRQPAQNFENLDGLLKSDLIPADYETICGYQYVTVDSWFVTSQAVELAVASAEVAQGELEQRLVDDGFACGDGIGTVTDGDFSADYTWKECNDGQLTITVGAVPLGAEFLVTDGEVLQVTMNNLLAQS